MVDGQQGNREDLEESTDKGNRSYSGTCLTFALLSIFQHHKLREPRRARACLSNSAYDAGQRTIVRSRLAEALSTPLVSEPQSVSRGWPGPPPSFET
jgi:hypothetical protein